MKWWIIHAVKSKTFLINQKQFMFAEFIKKWGPKKLILSVNDVLCTLIASFLSLYFTANNSFAFYISDTPLYEKIIIFLIGSILIIPIFRYYQLYKHKYFLKIGEQTLLILKGLLINSILLIIAIFLVKTQETLHDSRSQIILYSIISFLLLFFTRIFLFRKSFSTSYASGNINRFLSRRAIAIGAGALGKYFAEAISNKQHYHIDLLGYLDDDENIKGLNLNGVFVLGSTKNLQRVVEEKEIDEIYITIQKIENSHLLELIELCKLTNCMVNLVSNHFDIVNRKWDENEFHDLKIISVSSKVSPLYSEKFKRIFDIGASSLIILLSLPFTLLISLLIKLTSFGPVLYKTSVIGKDGKAFDWFKFRTMRVNNDQTIHKEYLKQLITENKGNVKLINDKRITGIGRILRKFSIDELPQLINVIRGEMSLVGPRPCLPYEYEVFKDWHKLRYKVIPGMTGLGQIIARNKKDVTFNDSIILDLYYADNQSLWLDIKILFRTIPVMVFGKGGV